MPKKLRKRPHKIDRSEQQECIDVLRMAKVVTEGIDREKRSLPLVLATENPVDVYDYNRMEVVSESIVMKGMEIPKQVPLVDSHARGSVVNVLGSIRDLEVKDGELVGRAYFASDATSTSIFEKYADGHLTDFSVGARAIVREYKETKNQKEQTKLLITKSELIEGSAVVIGADQNAKALVAQRAYAEPEILREEKMNEELMKLLVSRGLSEDATDKEVLEFLERGIKTGDLQSGDNSDVDTGELLQEIVRKLKESGDVDRNAKDNEPGDDESVSVQDELKREKKRWSDIDSLCREHGVDDEVRRGYLDGEMDVNEVAKDILKRNYKPSGLPVGPGQTIERGESERDKFYNAVEHAIVQRSFAGVEVTEELQREIGKAPAGADEFRYMRISEIARHFCERANISIAGLPPQEVIRKAMGIHSFVERAGGPAFHTTGSFPNLFLNSMNKTLRMAYTEAPSTYQRWVRQASEVSDFKNIDRIVFGEMNMPQEVPENNPYPEMTASDGKESYKVTKHGGIFSITLEMMVNDDLDAMTRRVRMQGNAMRRLINRDAYSILIDNNPLTTDNIALFHATSHGANLDANALSESALDTGFEVMATQSGLDSSTVLGLTPRFLIVPAALGASAQRLVSGGVVATTTGNVPLYGPGAPRSLEVIQDGQIDSLGTSTNWWLAADNNSVDTVEITFLQGESTPVVSRENGFDTDTIKAKIRQTYGIKAIDYRGLYQGNS